VIPGAESPLLIGFLCGSQKYLWVGGPNYISEQKIIKSAVVGIVNFNALNHHSSIKTREALEDKKNQRFKNVQKR
jgi:hypothetical protein